VILRHRLAGRLASIPYVRQAIDERADLSPFKTRPSVRLVTGTFLILISMLFGWPIVLSVFGALALYYGQPLILVVGGPIVYGFSWLIWLLGMALVGLEGTKYAFVFLRWLVRVGVERLIGRGTASQD